MAALFAAKKSPEKTILLVDIENGSVGSALVRISPAGQPKLFGQSRTRVPLLHTHDASKLAGEIEKAATAAMLHAQEVAARIRMHAPAADIGEVAQGMVFLHAPWSGLQFDEESRGDVTAVESFLGTMRNVHSSVAGDIPLSFHSFGASTAPLLSRLYNIPEDTLVCSLSGEITELFMVGGGNVISYATMPFGVHTLLRTLRSHAGLSDAESHSAMLLRPAHAQEALRAAAHHAAQEFADTARQLLAFNYAPQVLVVAQEPFAHWLAEALLDERVGEIFTQGGVVRAVRAAHILPYIAAHGGKPDLPLMLGSLFADAHVNAI